MKTRLPFFLLVGLVAAAAGYFVGRRPAPAGDGHSHPTAAAVYQCPMHPWIKSNRPGDKCTICGMDLVLATATGSNAAADPNLITLTPANVAVLDVRVSPVRRAPLHRTLRVTGVIDDDDTRHRYLTARVPGRVEKLFINFVGEEVTAGQPLATIYSPEVLTAEREYVERVKAGGSAFTLAQRAAARERLLDLDLTAAEIDRLEQTLEPSALVTLHSPLSGTVVARHVYEGQQLNKDQAAIETRLFEIGDFSSMWFVFDAHEQDLPWMRVGQTVEVTTLSQPGRVFRAPIAFIDPNLMEATRTVRVRVVLPNPDRALLHKQTAEGLVRLDSPETLLVPRSAVLQHTGAAVVYVDRGDRAFEARQIQLGRVGDDEVEVLAGLTEGEKVVTQGGMILDSQAQLARAATGDSPRPAAPRPAPAAAPPPAAAHEARRLDLLQPLALALADGAAALAADDLPAYQKNLPALRAALAAYLAADPAASREPPGPFAANLAAPADLAAARRDFAPLSTAVADLVRGTSLSGAAGLRIFQCPMTPVPGSGRWLQRTAELHNPFFGSAMPACGEEIK
ncbi:MAG: efflux RND transporter periplasmic adaptor subunit [Opitutae bacterium]|nr:efflux RND transporter periplasmic adaptor subunit [Opitutae bacterium]